MRWIFYTSGTTADPKGALHSDETIVAGSRGVAERFELGPDDRYPIVFPFTHIGGIGMLFVQLLTGAGAILVEQYDDEQTPPFLAAHGVTLAAGGTPLVMRYLQYQRRHPEARVFPRLRAAMGGAAPKPPLLHSEVKAELGGAGVVSVYGLTEAPFVVLSSPRDPDDALARSEGRAAGGAELRIVDADGTRLRAGRRGRDPRARPADLPRLSRRRSSTPRRSTPTASSAPAISDRSTRAASCASRGARRRSSSATARTSPRRRSRTCSTPIRRSRTRP